METIIKKDLYRYIGKEAESFKMLLRYFFFTPGFRYTFLFRKASSSKNKICKLFWHFLMRQCMLRTGIQIPIGTKIDKGFRISHFGHIVINPKAQIGKNFTISQGCLIGYSEGKNAGVPKIGNNVCMNANSIIVGGVTIGNNVLIAPGAFINFDVPDNSIVIGNPGQIIIKDYPPTNKYIIYKV